MDKLTLTCREVITDLQKMCASRRVPRPESDKLVEMLRKLRCSMRQDYERRKMQASLDKLHRGRPPDYPTA